MSALIPGPPCGFPPNDADAPLLGAAVPVPLAGNHGARGGATPSRNSAALRLLEGRTSGSSSAASTEAEGHAARAEAGRPAGRRERCLPCAKLADEWLPPTRFHASFVQGLVHGCAQPCSCGSAREESVRRTQSPPDTLSQNGAQLRAI
jgi:hypothetical protein